MKTWIVATLVFLFVTLLVTLQALALHRIMSHGLRAATLRTAAHEGRHELPRYYPVQVRLYLFWSLLGVAFLFGGASLTGREGAARAIGIGLIAVGIALQWARIVRTFERRAHDDAELVNSRLQRTPAAQARPGADEPQGRSTDHREV